MAVRKKNPDGVDLYPLDVDVLEKGDYISPEFCESSSFIKCHDRNHKDYQLQLLGLKTWIQRALESKGKAWFLRCRAGGIDILTDAQAATFYPDAFNRHLHAMQKVHLKGCVIDPSALTPDDRKAHERTVIANSRKLEGISRAEHELKFDPARRSTPSFPKIPGSVNVSGKCGAK